MSVTLEKIELLREKANISYAEAKEVLEKSNGDVLEALLLLESQAKIKPPKASFCKSSKGVWGSIKKVIKKGNDTQFIIKKDDRQVLSLPVTVLVVMGAFMLPLTVGGVLIFMATGHKLSFVKSDGTGMKINETIDKMSECVNSASDRVVDTIKKD